MATKSEFVRFVEDRLRPLGDVDVRAMFGGYGVYRSGLMFALIAEDELYFKTDDLNREEYLRKGCAPFTYEMKGKERKIAYYTVPLDVLEDDQELYQWGERAYKAALRKQSTSSTRTGKVKNAAYTGH